MNNILVQYLNREAIVNDSKLAYSRQINKIQERYEKGDIDLFAALICTIYALILCVFFSLFYQIKYMFFKGIYRLTSNNREPIHYWTEEEKTRLDVLDKLSNCSESVNNAIIIEKPKKLTQGECAVYLRNYLVKNKYILKGTVIKTTFPKITGEELLESNVTGSLNKPFMVQRITFGNDINKALKILYPKLKNRKFKGQTDTYIVFESNEVFELERELRSLMMQPVTINLRSNS